MAPTFSLSAAVFLLAGTAFAFVPDYPYQLRNSQPLPYYPGQQPPSYIVYPHGVYKLTNATNDTQIVKGQDFIFGAKGPHDKLLLHSTVYKRPGIWSSFASKEITFPPPGSRMRVNITQVSAYDKGINATGGFVKLIRGGVGGENVTLLFRSQRNRPINFELDIFGFHRP